MSRSPRWIRIYEVMYEADTRGGRIVDLVILVAIVASIIAVCLESVASFREQYVTELHIVEWVFTGLFTLEYFLRLLSTKHPLRYATSLFGIIDLLSTLPTWLGFFFGAGHSLLLLRALRLLRIFRILKLARFVREAELLIHALSQSFRKIVVFVGAVLTMVILLGAAMYLIEGAENGFSSIPQSMYWAIVTLTTVGYGDIAPVTVLGKFLASIIMIMGYGIIAVPTGIVGAGLMTKEPLKPLTTQVCPECLRQGHDVDALHCKYCSSLLNPADHTPTPGG